MSSEPETQDSQTAFRRTLLRVMSVQVITLVLLYILQQHFSS